jgi:hypothetical protein
MRDITYLFSKTVFVLSGVHKVDLFKIFVPQRSTLLVIIHIYCGEVF